MSAVQAVQHATKTCRAPLHIHTQNHQNCSSTDGARPQEFSEAGKTDFPRQSGIERSITTPNSNYPVVKFILRSHARCLVPAPSKEGIPLFIRLGLVGIKWLHRELLFESKCYVSALALFESGVKYLHSTTTGILLKGSFGFQPDPHISSAFCSAVLCISLMRACTLCFMPSQHRS